MITTTEHQPALCHVVLILLVTILFIFQKYMTVRIDLMGCQIDWTNW